jgi:predicted O-methyltransferase YrrM
MAVSLGKKIKTVLELIQNPKQLSALLSLKEFGYLNDVGWFNAFSLGEPVDKKNQPIPWFTYPCIDFLSQRLNKNLSVFELGSGNSTLFFATRVRNISSLEHNKEWFTKINGSLPDNSKLTYVESNSSDKYLETLKTGNEKFDIVIVDGIFRNECLLESINHLTEQGIIILDDSERNEYAEGISFVVNASFKRIDFVGIAPGLLYSKTTTIFYKSDNCLNL